MKIGVFDSGIGGMTVLYEALRLMPGEDYIYYADTENVPYGTKPKDEVKKYIFDAAEFMKDNGVDALVVACNTATSVAIEDLRKSYSIPIIGMEPAVKPAVMHSQKDNKRVLVTATPLAAREKKLKELITRLDSESIVDIHPLPRLVEFAESLMFDEERVLEYLKDEFKELNLSEYGTVVLGCTHFPLFKDAFRSLLLEDTDIIDGSLGTVNNLKRILEGKGELSDGKGSVKYYNSGKLSEDREKYEFLLSRIERIR